MINTQLLLRTIYFIFSFIMLSPLLFVLGIRSSFVVLAFFFFLIVVIFRKRISKIAAYLYLMIFVTSSISAIYWNDIKIVVMPFSLLFSILLVESLTLEDIGKIIDKTTVYIFILLIGALIGFILAFFGVSPILTLTNPDGRPFYLFFATFTNTYLINLIRPSGIYDEPGTFSFIICSIAAFRHLLDRNIIITWTILLLGLITFSVAHVLFLPFFLLATGIKSKKFLSIFSIFFIFAVVIIQSGFYEHFEQLLLRRFTLTDSGFVGDNRSFRLINAAHLIAEYPNSWLYGIDSRLILKYLEYGNLYPPFGENPLFQIVANGLLLSWPYYLFIIISLFLPIFKKKYFVIMGIMMLFLQRPFFLSISYSAIGVTALAIPYKLWKKEKYLSKMRESYEQ